jgi:drug/metabolite transporter (DMT)-like permease
MFISNIAYGCGTKHVPNATIPSVIRNCSFFVTAILAMALGREHVTGRDWVAMTLVAAGMALLAWDHPG